MKHIIYILHILSVLLTNSEINWTFSREILFQVLLFCFSISSCLSPFCSYQYLHPCFERAHIYSYEKAHYLSKYNKPVMSCTSSITLETKMCLGT